MPAIELDTNRIEMRHYNVDVKIIVDDKFYS